MTRQEALEKWKKESEPLCSQAKEEFLQNLENKTDELADTLKHVLEQLQEQTVLLEKEKMMFLIFSLLHCDILNGTYQILAQVLDARWYQDPEPAEVFFKLDFLFPMVEELKKSLSQESRKYLGKVNSYDIDEVIRTTAMECNGLLAQQLRFMLRDIEENEAFAAIEKLDIWGIYWGEYRDQNEVIAHVDREKKTQLDWDRALRGTKDEELAMAFGFWYGAELKGSDCRNKQLPFIQFEDCCLDGICFDEAVLSGARFRNCRIKNCSFRNTVMCQADFENCTWEENDFTGAALEHSIFPESELPFVHLEPEQLQVILIDRRQKA